MGRRAWPRRLGPLLPPLLPRDRRSAVRPGGSPGDAKRATT